MSVDVILRGAVSGNGAEVKAASTAPVAADAAQVVCISPNGTASATGLLKAEDAVAASGDNGIACWAVRRDVPATNVSAAGDYAEFGVSAIGTQWVTQAPVSAQTGYSTYHLISAATTNANNIKATAGQVYGWSITNIGAAYRYVKLYSKATAPAPATDTPLVTIGIAPSQTVIMTDTNGIMFAAGIGLVVVVGMAITDATAVGATEVAVTILWK